MPCPTDVVLIACDGVGVVLTSAEEVDEILVSAEEVIGVAAALGRPPVIVTLLTMKEKSRMSERRVSVAANEYDSDVIQVASVVPVMLQVTVKALVTISISNGWLQSLWGDMIMPWQKEGIKNGST